MSWTKAMLAVLVVSTAASCRSVYNMDSAKARHLRREGNVVFVRPDRYTPFRIGTRSLSDYVEIVYSNAKVNDAGLLEVTVGFRNKGGRHIWDLEGPSYPMSVKTTFYASPAHDGAPVYETNWQTVRLQRGETVHYKSVSVAEGAQGYQVSVSELIRQP